MCIRDRSRSNIYTFRIIKAYSYDYYQTGKVGALHINVIKDEIRKSFNTNNFSWDWCCAVDRYLKLSMNIDGSRSTMINDNLLLKTCYMQNTQKMS